MINKKFRFKILAGSIVLAIFSFNSNSVLASEYYKWVDSKGTTHYTKTPPPKSAKKRNKIKTYGYRSASDTTTQTTTEAQAPAAPEVVTPQAAPPEPFNSEANIVENPTPIEVPIPLVKERF